MFSIILFNPRMEKRLGHGKRRIFFDMDGTIVEWNDVPYYEKLYEEGYYRELKPTGNVIEAIHTLLENKEYEVYILSKYLTDSKYAFDEKLKSIKKHILSMKIERCILVPNEANKSDYIPLGIRDTDLLIDDYTPNLTQWRKAGGFAVNYLNGLNHTRGS